MAQCTLQGLTLACDEDSSTTTKTIHLHQDADDVSVSGKIVISLGDGTTKVIELGDQNVAFMSPGGANAFTFGPSGTWKSSGGNNLLYKALEGSPAAPQGLSIMVAPDGNVLYGGAPCPNGCCKDDDKTSAKKRMMFFGPGDGPAMLKEFMMPDIEIPNLESLHETLHDSLQKSLADHSLYEKDLHELLEKTLHEHLKGKLHQHHFEMNGDHLKKMKERMKDHGIEFDFDFDFDSDSDSDKAFDIQIDRDSMKESVQQRLKDHGLRLFTDKDGAKSFTFGNGGSTNGFTLKMQDGSDQGRTGEVIIVTPDGTQRFSLDGTDLPEAAQKILKSLKTEHGNTFEDWSQSQAEPNDDGVEVIELPLERRTKAEAARKNAEAKAKKAAAESRKAEAELAEQMTKLKKELADLEAQLKNLRERANPKR